MWEGRPTKDSLYFHKTVTQAEVCSALGLYSASTAPAAAVVREGVCSIWYPGWTLRTFSSCPDSEPTYYNLTCSTACPANCLQCTNASACYTCASGYFLSESGACVLPSQCGSAMYASFEAITQRPLCRGLLCHRGV